MRADIKIVRWNGEQVFKEVKTATKDAIESTLADIQATGEATSPVDTGKYKSRWHHWMFKYRGEDRVGGRVGAYPGTGSENSSRRKWYSMFVEVGTAKMPGQWILTNAYKRHADKAIGRIKGLLRNW